MKKELSFTLGLIGVMFFSACSGGSEPAAKETKPSATAGNNGNTASVSNGTELTAPQPGDANSVNGASVGSLAPVSNSVKRKIEAMREADSSVPRVDPAVLAAKNAKPAPDNSTFASYLGEEGFEIRTFKSHPQLSKVEKRTAADGTQTLKIFLRGGRVIEMPGNKINPLSTAPASLILQIANVQTQPTQPRAAGPVEKKQ